MKRVEYGMCALLALGGLGHLYGTIDGYEVGTEVFAWSLSASAFVFTIVFLHLVRIRRPRDLSLALGAIAATLAWAGVAFMFGQAIGSVTDPRVLMHVFAALGLVTTAVLGLTSPRTAMGGA